MKLQKFAATLLLMNGLQAGYDTVFMPLDAMGFTENFNLFLKPENRLNPRQAPRTNNLQLWQTKFPTGFGLSSSNGFSSSYQASAFRIGSHLGTTGITGPGVVFPANNTIDLPPATIGAPGYIDPTMMYMGNAPYFTATATVQQNNYLAPAVYIGYNNPSMTVSPALVNMIFSAGEVRPGMINPDGGFNTEGITTKIDPYGQSLQMTYAISDTAYLIDHVVLGNFFHDVYYNELSPLILSTSPLAQSGGMITLYVDGVMMSGTIGSMFSGSSFVLPIEGPAPNMGDDPVIYYLLLYFENPTASSVNLELMGTTNEIAFITAGGMPYTGWVRAAYLPVAGGMPITYGSDLPTPPPTTGFPRPIPTTTGPIQTNFMFNSTWFTEPTVQAIAAQPFSFFALFPYQWTDRIIQQTLLQTWNPTDNIFEWCGTFQGQYSLSPNGQTMALLIPYMAYNDGSITFTTPDTLFSIAEGYLIDITTNSAGWAGGIPTPPSAIGDSSQSLFSTTFAMGFMGGYGSGTGMNSIKTFQDSISANRPDYSAMYVDDSNIPGLLAILDMYRSAIPTACTSVTYTDQSMTWNYSLASVMAHSGSTTTNPLITFPGWFKLQNVASLIPIQYDSGIKGQIFTAPATSGSITFVEDLVWPTWMSSGQFLPTLDLPTLFGSNDTAVECLLNNLYVNEKFPWISATSYQWPSPSGFAPPLFLSNSTLFDGYGTGKILFQLGMTSEYMQAYLNTALTGANKQQGIINATEPLINFVKRILYDSLVIRPITQDHFVADSTNRGICFWGDPQPGFTGAFPYVSPPYINQFGLEQNSHYGVFVDFGNPIYNDHVLQYGYYLQAAAFVIEWDSKYLPNSADWWINQSVLGADGQLYKMWHYVDLLWRDTVNPFLEDDTGLPFMRSTNIWEGHGSAAGMQNIDPESIVSPTNPGLFMPSGLNLESICEDYNDVLGTFRYAVQMQAVAGTLGLTCNQKEMYSYLQNASFFNLKLRTSCARVLWYIVAQGYSDGPNTELTPIYNEIYTNFGLTAGNIFDVNITGNVAFSAGQPTNTPGASGCRGGTESCTPSPIPPVPPPPPP